LTSKVATKFVLKQLKLLFNISFSIIVHFHNLIFPPFFTLTVNRTKIVFFFLMELCKLDTYELACLCMPHLDGPILPPFKATTFANYEAVYTSLFITIVYTNCS